MREHWSLWRFVVVLLLAIHALLLLYGIHCHFATRNEVAHVPAGLAVWKTGTFTLYRVNPPLWRMLAVLPVLAAQPNTDFDDLSDAPALRQEWTEARRFADLNKQNYMTLIRLARLAGVLWSLLGGWLVYRWAGEIYGKHASLFALTLWCFGPNILAHAQLVTPDMPATVSGLVATYVFWHYLRRGDWDHTIWAGLLLGIAQLTKFTLLVLYPVWALLFLLYSLDPNNHAFRAVPLRMRIAQGLCIVLLSLLVLNAGYAFDGTGTPLGEYQFVSRLFNGLPADETSGPPPVGNRFHDTWLSAVPVPLPMDYLSGIDVQRRDFEGHMPPSFLAGEWRQGGWWYYYLYALAVKVPLGTLALVLWGLLLFVLRCPTFSFPPPLGGRVRVGGNASPPTPALPHKGGGRTAQTQLSDARFLDELTLWLPALAVLVLVSSQTGFNHHMRYVLPLFPFALIAASKPACYLQANGKYSLPPCGGGSGRGVEVPPTLTLPHKGGGKRLRGLLVLALLLWSVGSSLHVYPHPLSYFNELAGGPDNGHRHLLDSNIDWGQDLLFLKEWVEAHPEAASLGLAYFNFIDYRVCGAEFASVPRDPPTNAPLDEAKGTQYGPHPGYFAVDLHSLSEGGSYTYFQRFQPIAKAGYSIFIYHITPEQAEQARRAMGLALHPATSAR